MKRVLSVAAVFGAVFASSDALANSETFGNQGNFVIRTDTNIGGGMAPAAATNVGFGTTFDVGTSIFLAPAADYFVIKNLSVGAAMPLVINIAGAAGGGGTTVLFGLLGRVGYNLSFSDKFGIWPQAGIGFRHLSMGGGSDTAAQMKLSAPFMFHPADHFFLGLGPDFTTGFKDGTNNLGFNFVIGGYF